MKSLSSTEVAESSAPAKPERQLSTQLPDIDFARVGRANQNEHGMMNKIRSMVSSDRNDVLQSAAGSGGAAQATQANQRFIFPSMSQGIQKNTQLF